MSDFKLISNLFDDYKCVEEKIGHTYDDGEFEILITCDTHYLNKDEQFYDLKILFKRAFTVHLDSFPGPAFISSHMADLGSLVEITNSGELIRLKHYWKDSTGLDFEFKHYFISFPNENRLAHIFAKSAEITKITKNKILSKEI